MLGAEADDIPGAGRYERKDGERRGYRADHYERKVIAKAGRLTVRVPKSKQARSLSKVIDQCQRRESSVDETLIGIYLASVSTRRIDGISRALWDTGTAPSTLSEKIKPVYERIEQWRVRPLEHSHPYVFMDGVWHKRSWGGAIEGVGILVAIGVGESGHREVIGVTEGMKEDKASWNALLTSLIDRGLRGVRLVVGDRSSGLLNAVNALLPRALYQRCMVRFERNVLCKAPTRHMQWASDALKAVFASETHESALSKASQVAADMDEKKLKEAASCLREGIGETTAYLLDEFPHNHRRRIRTDNMIERLNREIRRRTRVVGAFPNGQSALMLICARIQYVAQTWSDRRYLDMSTLATTVDPTTKIGVTNEPEPRRAN